MHNEPQPGDLGVAPLPVRTTVTTAQAPDASYVVLQVQSPQGVAVFFLSPDHARDLAKHLAEYSTVAGSGLVIAGADQIPVTDPDGHQ